MSNKDQPAVRAMHAAIGRKHVAAATGPAGLSLLDEVIEPAQADMPDLLDEKAAARFLDVTPGTLSVWRSTGRNRIPLVKIGRNVRYRRTELEAWLEAHTHTTGVTG